MAIEDFTTYTEADPNSKITVTSPKVSWDDLSRNEEAYVYKSMGYGYFDKDFTHKFKIQFSDYGNGYSCRAVHWAVAQAAVDEYSWVVSSYNAVDLIEYNYDYRIYLVIYDLGIGTSDGWLGADPLETYYVTITRDRDGGVNNSGRYIAYICTNGYYGEGGDLEVTLQVDSQAASPVDYHYIFACNTYDDGNPQTIDGWTEDLDLGLAEAGFNPALAMRANNLLGV